MPIPIRRTEAALLRSLLGQFLELEDGAAPTDLDADEIKLVVDYRRSRLLTQIENLGLLVKPDLPKQEAPPATMFCNYRLAQECVDVAGCVVAGTCLHQNVPTVPEDPCAP